MCLTLLCTSFPNRNNALPPLPAAQGGFSSYPAKVQGVQERTQAPKFKEYYNQATLFYNSLTEVEKEHLISAAQFELGKCDEVVVQQGEPRFEFGGTTGS